VKNDFKSPEKILAPSIPLVSRRRALAVFCLPAAAFLPIPVLSSSQTEDSNPLSVTSTPAHLVNGTPILFQVKTAQILRTLRGDFMGRQVFFNFDASTGAWYGFAGVGLDTTAGRRPLKLEGTLLDGNRISASYPVAIERGDYRTITLRVPRRFTEPDEKTQKRIEQEREIKTLAFNQLTEQRWWSGPFAPPVDNIATDAFGTQRTFNGKVQSSHFGQDFRALEGTPVAAMNNAKVALARDMFYEGGFVVLNHGQGLLSLYMHLSKLFVREGEYVQKMQTVALSGGSGRATSPHLHVGVRWQGVYVDPATFLKLDLP
jgi:murein DD-endopeptidase MepM/ murein hydrolase activator NlpD